MKKLMFLFPTLIFFACGSSLSDSQKKISLDENLTYKVYFDETILQNEQLASVFETIDETKTDVLNSQIESIIVLNTAPFKFTEDTETVSGLFSNIKTGISVTASAIVAGISSASFEVKNQLAILYDLEETYSKDVKSKINGNLTDLALNLYPLEYLFEQNDILELDYSDKTVEFFNKNLKINEYLINDMVPAYRDVVMSFTNLHRTVVLNKLNKTQIDSLKLQILSTEDDFGIFENSGAIQDFKTDYLNYSKVIDLKKSKISSELEFMNEGTIKAIDSYISLMNFKINLMISFLGANDRVNVKAALVGDGPIVSKNAETHLSKIKAEKINKLLDDLSKL